MCLGGRESLVPTHTVLIEGGGVSGRPETIIRGVVLILLGGGSKIIKTIHFSGTHGQTFLLGRSKGLFL